MRVVRAVVRVRLWDGGGFGGENEGDGDGEGEGIVVIIGVRDLKACFWEGGVVDGGSIFFVLFRFVGVVGGESLTTSKGKRRSFETQYKFEREEKRSNHNKIILKTQNSKLKNQNKTAFLSTPPSQSARKYILPKYIHTRYTNTSPPETPCMESSKLKQKPAHQQRGAKSHCTLNTGTTLLCWVFGDWCLGSACRRLSVLVFGT